MTTLADQGARLLLIERGWDGPGSTGPDRWVVLAVVLFLGAFISEGYPTPTLFPTPAGGVRAEWGTAGQAWDVSADWSSGEVYVHALKVSAAFPGALDDVEDAVITWEQLDEIRDILRRVLLKPSVETTP